MDLILSCGDLKASYLTLLATFTHAPLLYVHGNHDTDYQRRPPEGCTCIEDTVYEVNGVRHDEMPVNQSDFHHARPIYEEFPGWNEDISGARRFEDLPKNAQDYILALEAMSGARISAIGVGPEREATIVRKDLLD